MRTIAAACLAAAALAGGARAQPLPAPSAAGPYQIVSNQGGKLYLMAIGSRVKSGGAVTITMISLEDVPVGKVPPRVDIALEWDCTKRASMNGVMAGRDLQGNLVQTLMSKNRTWTTAGSGAADQALVKFACEGTYAGPTASNVEAIAKAWRERPK
ncbi:MAG: hypothetical protein KA105_05855 [Caulobacter sp.]|nr:hypothetical protein [Caulobacter sp.]